MFRRLINLPKALAQAINSELITEAIVLLVVFMLTHSSPSLAAGDGEHGATVYRQCMACHALDTNGIGPRHRGVVGRKAGTLPDFQYSSALKASNIIWDDASLDKWLTNPQALVPGANMFFSLAKAQDRADVIAFLKEKAAGDPSKGAGGTQTSVAGP